MVTQGRPSVLFVGRAGELAFLRQWLDGPQRPSLVAVHGEAGVGKSRLVEEFGQYAADHGHRFVWGKWYASTALVPYSGFIEALTGLVPAAGDALDEATSGLLQDTLRRLAGDETARGAAPGDAGGGELFELMASNLTQIARGVPAVLALDDLHAADESSISLLGHLARRAAASHGLRFIAIWRDEEIVDTAPLAREIATLTRDGIAGAVPVAGLDVEHTGQLLQVLAAKRPSPDAVAALRELTGGNPLFIRELVHHASELGAVQNLLEARPDWSWLTPGLPSTIRSVILARLRGASPGVRETLAILSVLGREFEIGLVRSSGLLRDHQLAEAVPEAMRLGFLKERRVGADLRLAFSHPLVGAVLYASLDPVQRTGLHRQVARALQEVSVEGRAAQIAHHLVEGQDAADRPRALRFFVTAARQARAVLAHNESRLMWRQAFNLVNSGVPAEHAEREAWLHEHADACSSAGYPDEALDLYRELLALLEPKSDATAIADVYGAMGWTMHIHGRRSEIAQYLERALPGADVPPSHRIASLLAAHAVGLLSSGRLGEGQTYLNQALEMAQQNPQLGADGIVNHLAIVWHTWDPAGDSSLLPDLIDRADRFFRDQRNEWSRTRLHIDAAVSHFFLGDLDKHSAYLESALAESRRIGSTAFEADAMAFRSYVAYLRGDWAAADEDAGRCEPYLEAAGGSIYAEGLRRGRALRHLWQGRPQDARGELAKLNSFLNASLEPHLKLAEGDRDGAAASLATILPLVPAEGHGGVWLMFALSCASALCSLGRAREAARWENALEAGRHWFMDWWQPLIELGRIARGARAWRRAFSNFEAAVERFDSIGWQAFAAIARLEYAEARAERRKAGDRQRAKSLLETAEETFEQLDMSAHLQRARRLQSSLTKGRPLSASSFNLSERELAVLRAIAKGLTNRAIADDLKIGPRTVETHVSNILAKLDVPTRAAAAAEAARRRLI